MRIVVLVFLLVASPALAAEGARARLQAFSADLRSLRADWTQTVTAANGEVGETARGTLALAAPRQFRWDVLEPYRQQIVADGQKVWVYDPDLLQVTVRDQGAAEAHSPLTVLTDLSQLERDFETREAGRRDGLDWLRLVSRAPEPEFEYAELGFSASALERMVFKDLLGNVTEIRFDHWQRNADLPADTFRFVPPDGVDVIGDPAPVAEVFPVRD